MPLLLLLLSLKALASIAFVLWGPLALTPDEAQYWLWSKFLDVGYYSKPPGIAWEIFCTTKLFGNTELGVRFGGILFSFFLSLATFDLARAVGAPAKRAALIIALCPIGILGGFAATTDLGFVLFWTLGIAALLRRRYPLLGVYILLGSLFKWTIFLILPLLFFHRTLRSLWAWGIALLGLMPSLYWNWLHDFATFRHVAGQSVNPASSNPLSFFFAQVGLLFPIFFYFLIVALVKHRKNPCVLLSVGILALYTILACFQKMQANWAIFAYPLAAVGISLVIPTFWFHFSLITSTLLASFSLLFTYPSSLFKSMTGWRNLKEALQKSGYDPNSDVLVADSYQMASLLSFYSEGQKRAYFLNIFGRRLNQFSFWPPLAKGASGFFVYASSQEPTDLSSYFERTHPPQSFLLAPGKYATTIAVEGYLGIPPAAAVHW